VKLSLAYANRSAVYFEVGKYEECLQNIQLAKNSNYPKDKLKKLIEREEKCKKLKQENVGKAKEIPDKFFKLSYPPIANPNFAGCLELRDKKYYTNRDLKPGDIVFIGEMKKMSITIYGYINRCYGCFNVNSMNLIPSLYTAERMFCSLDCRDKESSKYSGWRPIDLDSCLKCRLRYTFDPCPVYHESRSNFKYVTNPFDAYTVNATENNLSFFIYDGNKKIFFAAKPIKAGAHLFYSGFLLVFII
jgi:hypothetical protein